MGGVTGPQGAPSRLVVLANRLPIEPRPPVDPGDGRWRRAIGGMVTALAPVIEETGGAWIGWDRDTAIHLVDDLVDDNKTELHPIRLPGRLATWYYDGFSNSSIWPIYHDLAGLARRRRVWWWAYQRVNRYFARAAERIVDDNTTVWVHDYQLQLVPGLLRQARPDLRIGFFLHIPVPTPAALRRLPHHAEILRGLLGADLIGVQRESDATALRRLFREELGLASSGSAVTVGGRDVVVRAFPSSVDVWQLTEIATSSRTYARMAERRAELGRPRRVVLSVERLDYTKGVEQRLLAYRDLLERGLVDPAETVLLQVLTPTRLRIGHYRALAERVRVLIDGINEQFGRVGRPAVAYWDRALTLDELVPLYRIADVMAVTPVRDGMNLVAKEYVASRVDLDGALVLSEHCGAADEMRAAYLVDPLDTHALSEALLTALRADRGERRRRMVALRSGLDGRDARRWGNDFLEQLSGRPVAVDA